MNPENLMKVSLFQLNKLMFCSCKEWFMSVFFVCFNLIVFSEVNNLKEVSIHYLV